MERAADDPAQPVVGRLRVVRPGSWSLWSHPGRLVGYVLTVDAVAFGLVLWWLLGTPVLAADLPKFGILLALMVGYGEVTRRIEQHYQQERDRAHFDFNSVWAFAGVLLLHPALTSVLAVVAHLYRWVRVGHRPAHRVVFNIAAAICCVLAASGVVAITGHLQSFPDLSHDLGGLMVIFAAAVVKFSVNMGLVAIVIMLSYASMSPRKVGVQWIRFRLEAGTLALGALLAWALVDWPAMTVLIVGVTVLLHGNLLLHQLMKAASTDVKTGLLNTVAWYEAAQRELDRARRLRASFGVLIVDLDHFKRVNDQHGHLAGDEVLMAVAESISGQVRDRDVVGRFGGEEFVVLLSGTDGAGALAVAERIRAGISGLSLRVIGHHGPVSMCGVTASVGAAAFPWHGDRIDGLLRAADEALFVAKSDGRDQVRLAAPAGVVVQD